MASNLPPITDHAFIPRYVYKDGRGPATLLPDKCGFVVDMPLNSILYDVSHCNRPENEHAAATEPGLPGGVE